MPRAARPAGAATDRSAVRDHGDASAADVPQDAAGSGSTDRAAAIPSSGAAAPPAPTPNQLRRAEYTLIGACLVSSDVRQLTEGRLRVGDFVTPEIVATWQAISTVQQRREPVDFVLVAAEVERQGDLPGIGRGLAPEQLAQLVGRFAHVAAAPGYKALEAVAHAAMTRAVRDTHDQLHHLAGTRTQSSEEILANAQQTIEGAEKTVRRLAGTPQSAALAALSPPAAVVPSAREPRSETPAPLRSPAPAPAAPVQRRR